MIGVYDYVVHDSVRGNTTELSNRCFDKVAPKDQHSNPVSISLSGLVSRLDRKSSIQCFPGDSRSCLKNSLKRGALAIMISRTLISYGLVGPEVGSSTSRCADTDGCARIKSLWRRASSYAQWDKSNYKEHAFGSGRTCACDAGHVRIVEL